jgi:2,3-bisphosphoglycerate-dependent phosphoglycerate mutase
MAELEWLGVIRHGESTGNVAATQAETGGLELIEIAERDADVPLSETGQEQATAVGHWLASLPGGERPEVVIASPYLRAMQTAELALADTGIPMTVDERLRDRELGILDLLTAHGVRTRLPEEAIRRRRLGKFYYRPPGGESWADVTLRLRSLLGDLRRDHPDGRVLLVGHEAIVLLLRYLIEQLSEADVVTLARKHSIANGSRTTWERTPAGNLSIVDFNRTDHLRLEGAPTTREDEVHAEPV